MSHIFIIDDDKSLCRSLELQLGSEGHQVSYATGASEGLAFLAGNVPDLVLLDLKLPDASGLDVLHRLQQRGHPSPVVMITGHQDMKATIDAMRSGAFDYIRKPFDLADLILMMEKIERFKASRSVAISPAAPETQTSYEIVGADKKILEVIKQIGLLSRSKVTVLIQGESGTGKELVARALHEATSPGRPFVPINCSAVVPTLFESELFGHEKGAFTGAHAPKVGKLESAGDGTIFFDEIGDMPLDLQAKILRVLQESEFERVGSLKPIRLRARVIAATHHDLGTLVSEGRFRQDLFYRLCVSQIVLPPLRERKGDIPLLARRLLESVSRKLHRPIQRIEEEALERLQRYDWPGNVRELENVLTRAVALAKGDTLTADQLEFSVGASTGRPPSIEGIKPLAQAEKDHIETALRSTGWNITHTAKLLRISPTTLRKKIADFGLRNL